LINNYAGVLVSLGRSAEAEPLARRAVELAVKNPSLGPGHPNTKAFANVHAAILDALKRTDEAAAVRKRFDLSDPATRPTSVPTQ